uniref:ShKT domain-containing protein n=1 Tax=Strongyloides venezuelensis TaxID=75913 RepID=A0A0K0G4W0_STRVS
MKVQHIIFFAYLITFIRKIFTKKHDIQSSENFRINLNDKLIIKPKFGKQSKYLVYNFLVLKSIVLNSQKGKKQNLHNASSNSTDFSNLNSKDTLESEQSDLKKNNELSPSVSNPPEILGVNLKNTTSTEKKVILTNYTNINEVFKESTNSEVIKVIDLEKEATGKEYKPDKSTNIKIKITEDKSKAPDTESNPNEFENDYNENSSDKNSSDFEKKKIVETNDESTELKKDIDKEPEGQKTFDVEEEIVDKKKNPTESSNTKNENSVDESKISDSESNPNESENNDNENSSDKNSSDFEKKEIVEMNDESTELKKDIDKEPEGQKPFDVEEEIVDKKKNSTESSNTKNENSVDESKISDSESNPNESENNDNKNSTDKVFTDLENKKIIDSGGEQTELAKTEEKIPRSDDEARSLDPDLILTESTDSEIENMPDKNTVDSEENESINLEKQPTELKEDGDKDNMSNDENKPIDLSNNKIDKQLNKNEKENSVDKLTEIANNSTKSSPSENSSLIEEETVDLDTVPNNDLENEVGNVDKTSIKSRTDDAIKEILVEMDNTHVKTQKPSLINLPSTSEYSSLIEDELTTTQKTCEEKKLKPLKASRSSKEKLIDMDTYTNEPTQITNRPFYLCQDLIVGCEFYKMACSDNTVGKHISNLCPYTCDKCQKPLSSVCHDTFNNCLLAKHFGYCESILIPDTHRKQYCQKTCGLCSN